MFILSKAFLSFFGSFPFEQLSIMWFFTDGVDSDESFRLGVGKFALDQTQTSSRPTTYLLEQKKDSFGELEQKWVNQIGSLYTSQ